MMKTINRRRFMGFLFSVPIYLISMPRLIGARDCGTGHPLRPPRKEFKGRCPVCGMARAMWARTWITFDAVQGVSETCSFHCLADWTQKSGQNPSHVQLALYHDPQTMIAAQRAVIVMGSSAAGTMSPVSKIVFADRKMAAEFAATCGGQVIDYKQALAAAAAGVAEENRTIGTRRLKKGVITEPTESDRCPVCDMFPARYPYGKCQIKSVDGRTLHFCSTQCLFAFLGRPAHYVQTVQKVRMIWVVDRVSGMWISARTAFYVIGATKVFGPMGYEAFAFGTIEDARAFADKNGGRVAAFNEISIDEVVPGWKY